MDIDIWYDEILLTMGCILVDTRIHESASSNKPKKESEDSVITLHSMKIPNEDKNRIAILRLGVEPRFLHDAS